jgi:hypothetical protein
VDENTTSEMSPAAMAAWSRVAIDDEFGIESLSSLEFAARVMREGIAHLASRRWPTAAESLEPVLPHAVMTFRWRHGQSALLELAPLFGSDCIGCILCTGGHVFALVGARDLPVVTEALDWLAEQFPERVAEESSLPVTFWSVGDHGGGSLSRNLEVPRWEEIADNYPAQVAGQLEKLMATSFDPGDGGKLILWHGPPGTGKTHALRALGREWCEWCELHYVTDPEQFFGGRANYMINVMLRGPGENEDAWRLLVFEDTGELLAADAKERTGQGLSRLLNLVDGVIGQGLRVLVLVTTNEELKHLHPAVARPGRCAAKVEFLPFRADEARAWLARHEAADADCGGGTLAELYARAAGQQVEARAPVGFGA